MKEQPVQPVSLATDSVKIDFLIPLKLTNKHAILFAYCILNLWQLGLSGYAGLN